MRLVFGYVNGSQGTSFQGDIQLDDIRLDGTTYSFENTGHSWQTTTSNTLVSNYSSASFSTLATGTTKAGKWNVDSGGTPSSGTGRTDADAGTYYVYAETSSGANGQGYILRSPAVTLGSSPTLSYAVARNGGNIGDKCIPRRSRFRRRRRSGRQAVAPRLTRLAIALRKSPKHKTHLVKLLVVMILLPLR